MGATGLGSFDLMSWLFIVVIVVFVLLINPWI